MFQKEQSNQASIEQWNYIKWDEPLMKGECYFKQSPSHPSQNSNFCNIEYLGQLQFTILLILENFNEINNNELQSDTNHDFTSQILPNMKQNNLFEMSPNDELLNISEKDNLTQFYCSHYHKQIRSSSLQKHISSLPSEQYQEPSSNELLNAQKERSSPPYDNKMLLNFVIPKHIDGEQNYLGQSQQSSIQEPTPSTNNEIDLSTSYYNEVLHQKSFQYQISEVSSFHTQNEGEQQSHTEKKSKDNNNKQIKNNSNSSETKNFLNLSLPFITKKLIKGLPNIKNDIPCLKNRQNTIQFVKQIKETVDQFVDSKKQIFLQKLSRIMRIEFKKYALKKKTEDSLIFLKYSDILHQMFLDDQITSFKQTRSWFI